jgi:hypothetical protein
MTDFLISILCYIAFCNALINSSNYFYFILFVALGLEFRTYTFSHSNSPFSVKDFFEIGSHELFAWAGFEPRSS